MHSSQTWANKRNQRDADPTGTQARWLQIHCGGGTVSSKQEESENGRSWGNLKGQSIGNSVFLGHSRQVLL